MQYKWGLLLGMVAAVGAGGSEYQELLEITPLSRDYLLSSFTFNTSSADISAVESNHFDILPRSLLQIARKSHTTSLHLRFSRGRWNQQVWGSLPHDGRRTGGTGIEVWASIDSDSPAEDWTRLVNSLSGMFCASLNFIDGTRTIKPRFALREEFSTGELFYGSLPQETVCTENLTPFLKLLPCKGHAGISSLLSGHKLFDTDWSVLSVDLDTSPVGGIKVTLGVDLVFDLQRALSTARDPLPASQPSEELICAEDKFYTSDVTCFPQDGRQFQDWSFTQIFGKPLSNRCSVADEEATHMRINHGSQARLVPHSQLRENEHSSYILQEEQLNLQYSDRNEPMITAAPIEVRRTLTSHGSSLHGKITLAITNKKGEAVDIVYFSTLPWFMRPYLHTLSTSHKGVIYDTVYEPEKDRIRPTHLEMKLKVPANEVIVITFEFERTVLRYAEYPPDANRGFDVP